MANSLMHNISRRSFLKGIGGLSLFGMLPTNNSGSPLLKGEKIEPSLESVAQGLIDMGYDPTSAYTMVRHSLSSAPLTLHSYESKFEGPSLEDNRRLYSNRGSEQSASSRVVDELVRRGYDSICAQVAVKCSIN